MVSESFRPDSSIFFVVPLLCVAFHFFCDAAPGGFAPHSAREWHSLLLRTTGLISVLLCYIGYSCGPFLLVIGAAFFAAATLILSRSSTALSSPSFIVYSGWFTLLASLLPPAALLLYR